MTVCLPRSSSVVFSALRALGPICAGFAVGFAALAAAQAAAVDPALPHYEARAFDHPRSASWINAEGAVVVVGYNDMQEILQPLAARFAAAHPGIRLALDLRGTRFAPEALAQGRSAFAPMGALFTPPQLQSYRATAGHEPMAFRVAHASLDARALSGPLAVFVHRDNPLAALTLEQIARIYSGQDVRWGELGLQGEWAARAIHAIGVKPGTALAFEFQQKALGTGDFTPGMTGFAQSAEVVAQVATDMQAIGFAAAMRGSPSVRALAIAQRTGEAPMLPTHDNIIAGRYPLDRYLLIYAARPLLPLAREFLRLALSREGQEAVAASPQGYLPLTASEAAIERAKLD